jgi:hypothetical protein
VESSLGRRTMKMTRSSLTRLTVGFLLLLPASASYATTCIEQPVKPIRQVRGIVIDSTGEPIPNAKVTVLKAGTELVVVKTSADGKFSFERLEAGDYEIRIQADGFIVAGSSVLLVKPTTKRKSGLQIVLAMGMQCSSITRTRR